MTDKHEIKKEDYFIFNGKEDYYGRRCKNYGVKCERCKWENEYQCREGSFRG